MEVNTVHKDYPFRTFMEPLLKKAGRTLVRRFQKIKGGDTEILYFKSPHIKADAVTASDRIVDNLMYREIHARFPGHQKIGEERPYNPPLDAATEKWLYDPLDGTLNFSGKDVRFAVMMAFARGLTVEAAGIYHPFSDRFYFAQKGRGLYLNEAPLVASKQTIKWWSKGGCVGGKNEPFRQRLAKLLHPETIAGNECIAFDAQQLLFGNAPWLVSVGSKVWDYAPVALILQEAGLIVTNAEGRPYCLLDGTLVAAPADTYPKILAQVQQALEG